MPYSIPIFDNMIREQLIKKNPRSILDIGAGAGKYGKLLREALPNCKIDAVEATESYIDRFDLKSIYNNVYNLTIEEYLDKHPKNQYDIVSIGDMLEHLYRSRVVDYLDFLTYRTGWIMCIWPTNLPQDDWEGNGFECHRSNFKLKDLADHFNVEFFGKKFLSYFSGDHTRTEQEMNYCVIKGIAPYKQDNFLVF